MDSEVVEAYTALGLGAALVAFVVIAGALLYISKIPTTTLTIDTKLGPLQIGDMPDPYAVAVAAVRALVLLALGLTGGKLLEVGLKELREVKRERAVQAYYQQYYDVYYQQQY
ncbi:MAG: hypothetical protein QXP98_01785 [Thermoproteus sp.]